MNLQTILFAVVGLVALVGGAELLVRGASRLAAAVGISPLVVGLTVVAFGTSSPELAVSVMSSLDGQGAVAVGNIIGSNIFNVLFILGISALITPLAVEQKLLRLEVPLMIGASVLMLLLALDGRFGRLEGALLVLGVVAFTVFAVRQSRKESRAVQQEYAQQFGAPRRSGRALGVDALLVLAGLGLLVLGSRWLVEAAVAFATYLGVSELVIGLTIVAAGTSLPEVATSILAALRGERDIAVGNVVGSNLFNVLAVLGFAAAVTPGGIEVPAGAIRFDLPVMVAVAVATLPIFFTGSRIDRWEGGLLLAWYAAYTVVLILAASQHPSLRTLSSALLLFALPLTGVTLLILAAREWRVRRRPA